MAYKRKISNEAETVEKDVEVEVTENIEEKMKLKKAESKIVEPVIEREYKGDDLIPCRSMTKGELIYVGKKTKEVYTWADYDDVTEVEYQDLLALTSAKSPFIFETLFIIEDEELIETTKWKDVKAIYEQIYSDDVPTLISMDTNKFKKVFPTLPNGLKRAVVTEVATQMEAGTFDSIQKIKLIDELCNTDLAAML